MKKNQVRTALDRLKAIYALYDAAVKEESWICRPKCAVCCTCNVTLTRLEADYILDALSWAEKEHLACLIKQNFPEKRYIPQMTSNRFARMCMDGTDMPAEENDPAFGVCPLLTNNLCQIYSVRPFGCRALLSRIHCKDRGFAEIPPLILTLNTVFLQIIEQLDANGFSGNLSDVLSFVLSGTRQDRQVYFLSNEKIPMLMVPREHREKVSPVLEKLGSLLKAVE